jgi:hypothetical protein
MKKFSLILMAVLALGFTACDDYEEPNPAAQSNPQEAIFSTEGITITPSDESASAFDLKDLADSSKNVAIYNVVAENIPDGYELAGEWQVSTDQNFSRYATLDATTVDGQIVADPQALQDVYYANVSKSPKQKDIYVRLALYAVNGTSKARIGGPDVFFGGNKISVIPMPSSLVIEDNYYLLGSINGWSVATAVKFEHSGESGYDNPVFTLKVDISADEAAAGWWWKIVPQSVYELGDWGSGANSQYGVAENGSEDLEGMLIAHDGATEPGAGCIKQDGQWLITINLEEGTYSFTSAVDYLYTPGNSNGWSHLASQMLYTSNYADYQGYAHLNGDFKFTNAPDWNHVNYGSAGEGLLTTDGSAGNISAPADGLYWCQVNTAALTYSITQVTTYGVIGGFNSWGAQENLTPSADFLTWTGTVTIGAGDEWKFRANDNWDINLGGSLDNLTPGGDNIKTTEAGTYKITLDLSTLPYKATISKQ